MSTNSSYYSIPKFLKCLLSLLPWNYCYCAHIKLTETFSRMGTKPVHETATTVQHGTRHVAYMVHVVNDGYIAVMWKEASVQSSWVCCCLSLKAISKVENTHFAADKEACFCTMWWATWDHLGKSVSCRFHQSTGSISLVVSDDTARYCGIALASHQWKLA